VNKALKQSVSAAQEGDSPRDSAEAAEISEESPSAIAQTNTDAIQYYNLQTHTYQDYYCQTLLATYRYYFLVPIWDTILKNLKISNADEILFLIV